MLHCPVGIDTGKLIKGFRAQKHRGATQRLALQAARSWDKVERASRTGLRVARRVPARRFAGLPGPAPALPATTREGAAAVYLPACINRIFGPAREGPSLPEALVAVSARAGLPVWIPDDVAGTCCGTPWTSKGYTDGAAAMASATAEKLRRWSDDGRLPVVIDASSCALGLVSDVAPDLPIVDSVTWANDNLLPRLQPSRLRAVALHPPCGARHLGTDRALAALAGALAEDVVVPPSTRCCGFAGDRGFLHPELTASATSGIAAELDGLDLDAHVCSNRTCEIGLRQATGAPYESVVHVLERTTR
jgi:D-lactate dehydrogenase